MQFDLYALQKGCMITLRNGEEWEVQKCERSWRTHHNHHVYATDLLAYISNHYYDDGTINGNGIPHPEDIIHVAPF